MKRIQNLILDMGNVITKFEPKRFVSFYAESAQDRERLAKTIFGSPEYRQLDLGTISYEEATKIWQARCPELADEIAQVSDHWFEHKQIIEPMNRLAVLMKAKGYGLYLLSNASDKFPLYQDKVPALAALDGAILSCYYHVLKPDLRLYRVLFDTYGLDPETCFFVDDSPENIRAGRELGMDGYVFPKDADAADAVKGLLKALSTHGIFIDYSEVEEVNLTL